MPPNSPDPANIQRLPKPIQKSDIYRNEKPCPECRKPLMADQPCIRRASVTGLPVSIPFERDPVAGVLLLSGVGAVVAT
jgi:hypothetical protein